MSWNGKTNGNDSKHTEVFAWGKHSVCLGELLILLLSSSFFLFDFCVEIAVEDLARTIHGLFALTYALALLCARWGHTVRLA